MRIRAGVSLVMMLIGALTTIAGVGLVVVLRNRLGDRLRISERTAALLVLGAAVLSVVLVTVGVLLVVT